ncbi:transposase [Subtercola boreus]|uniref:transposase n=1 Tax=Subtercola boreus TaxID=120213 RepID=UPI0011C056AF|nr:transposase [Subtercola boreus]
MVIIPVEVDGARRGAYTWIDGWYNARRRHSGIGYLSPLEYERRQLTLAAGSAARIGDI